ncbi:MAG: carbohydrate ABC transporter permease [Lachnospiraceae bacterium]|nr:carbohydrate ABC transporter permease [Lachnospiraceae bacterium]
MLNCKMIQAKRVGAVLIFWLYKGFRLFILLGLSYLMLHPILTMISLALTPPKELFVASRAWIPMEPTFTNFVNSMKYFDFFEHAWNSVQISVICTLLQLVSCSLTGYGLARFRFKGSSVVFFLMLMTIIVPLSTAAIPLYLDWQNFDFFGVGSLIGVITGKPITMNLLDTHWVLYIPAALGVGLNSGLYIFLFRQFFKGMPRDLEDAGKVDGCNAFKLYLKIMLPNTKPVFATVALLSVISYWNDTAYTGMFIHSAARKTLMMMVGQIQSLAYSVAGTQAYDVIKVEFFAIVLLIIAPLVLIFIVCQRFFVECMDRSGIKG